jgi:hypothetical protein
VIASRAAFDAARPPRAEGVSGMSEKKTVEA